ncbi:MAG: nuclear transport factor 2 family protein, partial [Acidobacteriia bacterium]|nr:nuclear transport factor 2 family protein [Terriglobia bacterium]MBV8906603.1 nuclear transport factor 2 family protein [Terriglobia bacterium]
MFRANRIWLAAIVFLAAALFPIASTQTKSGINSSLTARVQRLEDLEEVRTALTDYGRFLDARDFASYAHLFAKDGEWVGGLGTVQGPAAIQTFMEKNV